MILLIVSSINFCMGCGLIGGLVYMAKYLTRKIEEQNDARYEEIQNNIREMIEEPELQQ